MYSHGVSWRCHYCPYPGACGVRCPAGWPRGSRDLTYDDPHGNAGAAAPPSLTPTGARQTAIGTSGRTATASRAARRRPNPDRHRPNRHRRKGRPMPTPEGHTYIWGADAGGRGELLHLVVHSRRAPIATHPAFRSQTRHSPSPRGHLNLRLRRCELRQPHSPRGHTPRRSAPVPTKPSGTMHPARPASNAPSPAPIGAPGRDHRRLVPGEYVIAVEVLVNSSRESSEEGTILYSFHLRCGSRGQRSEVNHRALQATVRVRLRQPDGREGRAPSGSMSVAPSASRSTSAA